MPRSGPNRARLRRAVAALLLPPGAALAGCGSDDDEGRTATVPARAPGEVVGDEYSFDPKTLVVEGAQSGRAPLEIKLRNDGSLAHNLRIFDGGREIGGTPTFDGGDTRGGKVTLSPGRYRMVCTVGDHEALGMEGTLEVRARK